MRRALLTFAAALLLAPVLHAQSLDQKIGGCNGVAPLRTIQANPSTYKSLLTTLQPGDRLQLAAGTYTQQLRISNRNGAPGKCIVIEGPASGSPAIFTGSSTFNTISLINVSYMVFRNLTLDGKHLLGDGVKVEASSAYAHHITLENLLLSNYDESLQRCGISTKGKAWNFVIRYNTIARAGVGLYLGKPDGTAELVNSLIEHNLVKDSMLYNMEIKHQIGRDTAAGIPSSGTTIIRHNVFSKETGAATGTNARPNVLVGHWPLSGAGSTDTYQVYGNLFYQNPTEALFQGEGNIALHDNLFVNRVFSRAIRIQKHNDLPRQIDIFNNTVVASGEGIVIYNGDPAYSQRVRNNVVFAATPLVGGQQSGNLTGAFSAASQYLNNPGGSLTAGTLDLFPIAGKVTGTTADLTYLSGLVDWDKDFNGYPRLLTYRGAYSDDGVNPGWQPALQVIP
ncbi:MAG TPA: hypothetical protein VH394_02410 [Thermoanaerobaculia bacterium]|jgi:hypothetical protein|nr:hypothetical protein [Thermoanaerobaculia bacterium]